MSDLLPDPGCRTEAASTQRPRRPQASWEEIGESLETMGRIGLAMAVGLSAAGFFCRLADQGKVKIPTLTTLLLSRSEPDGHSSAPRKAKRTNGSRASAS